MPDRCLYRSNVVGPRWIAPRDAVRSRIQIAAQPLARRFRDYPAAEAAQVADEAFQLQDKYLSGVCFFRKGKYIGGYANMPDGASAAAASVILAARVR